LGLIGRNFFEKKFLPNPLQKTLNYMERQRKCRLEESVSFVIRKNEDNPCPQSSKPFPKTETTFFWIKVFEKGFGEKLFSKSFSPKNSFL